MRKVLLVVSLFLFSCQSNETEKLTVGIQPYGIFPEDKTDTIAKTIAEFYQIKTVILPAKELYKEAFIEVKTPRYRADKMINLRKRIK